MRRLLLLAGLLAATPALAQSVYVKPHIRSDGTFVQGHWRSAPNNTKTDNYSTYPNVNPYTGERGTQPAYPTYPRVRTYPNYPNTYEQDSPLPYRTQQRWQQTMPLTCKYSTLC